MFKCDGFAMLNLPRCSETWKCVSSAAPLDPEYPSVRWSPGKIHSGSGGIQNTQAPLLKAHGQEQGVNLDNSLGRVFDMPGRIRFVRSAETGR